MRSDDSASCGEVTANLLITDLYCVLDKLQRSARWNSSLTTKSES
jgi:hypothetical protein